VTSTRLPGRMPDSGDGAEAVADGDPRKPRIRDGLRDTVIAFLAARFVLFAISAMGGGLLPLPPDQPPLDAGYPPPALAPGWHMVITATERQDALWFLRIAEDGYRAGDNSAAFFPLYPAAIRIMSSVPGIGPLRAALLVSNTAALAGLLMLHALTRRELGPEPARRTVWFAAFFPTSFFFLAPYTESTFLLFSVSAFWFARRDRWALAGAMGALAALTRSVGALLLPALAVEALRQWLLGGRPPLPRFAGAAAVALGPLGYFAYWQVRFHDFWRPLEVQRNWRPAGTTWPTTSLWHAIDNAWHYQTWWLMDLLVVALAVLGVMAATRRIPATYSVYAGASLILPLLFPLADRPLLSVPRFAIVVFPVAWGYACLTERRPNAAAAVLAAFAAGYGLFALLFINWWYIF
jgi:mannosyltransferase PIG-V